MFINEFVWILIFLVSRFRLSFVFNNHNNNPKMHWKFFVRNQSSMIKIPIWVSAINEIAVDINAI